MRVLVMVMASKESEAGQLPSAERFDEMTKFNEELVRAGVMLAGEGLKPSSAGKRVEFSGTKRRVIDGPFTETKELVAGYWLWQVKSMDEALEWMRRCPNPHESEGVVEIRPLFEADDFGENLTPETRRKEIELRAQIERRQNG